MITQAELKEYLSYNADTGDFYWLKKPRRSTAIGGVAGGVHRGYWAIGLFGKSYPAHRLAWLYTYGEFPPHMIDHINRNKLDNRMCNLRPATRAENCRNTHLYSNNTSGHRGVMKRILTTGRVRWVAAIRRNGKLKILGSFDTPEEAGVRYAAAANNHDEFCGQTSRNLLGSDAI